MFVKCYDSLLASITLKMVSNLYFLFLLFGMLNLMIKEDNYRLTRSKARIEFVPWLVHNALFFSLKKNFNFCTFFFSSSLPHTHCPKKK